MSHPFAKSSSCIIGVPRRCVPLHRSPLGWVCWWRRPRHDEVRLLEVDSDIQACCLTCARLLTPLIAGSWQIMTTTPSHALHLVRWCSNLDCPACYQAAGEPYLVEITGGVDRRDLRAGRACTDYPEPTRVRMGSKIGGYAYACNADLGVFSEFLAAITASDLHKPGFPEDADLLIVRTVDQVGYVVRQ